MDDGLLDDVRDLHFHFHHHCYQLQNWKPNALSLMNIPSGQIELIRWKLISYQHYYQSMKKFEQPFLHYSIENFLGPKESKLVEDVYNHFEFFEKESDLFHFYQTNQLTDEASLGFLKKELNKVFGKLCPLEDTSYNIFASMYFEGDYLLCHDDVVEDRKYAFCYYLDDHPSADLVFFDETATQEAKRVQVKKNLLVIFEVSNISYHEVALAKQDGRKAITGWLNKKGQGATRTIKVIPPYQPFLPQEITQFELDFDVDSQECFKFENLEYIFDAVAKRPAGPIYEKRATRIELSQYVVLDIKGYSLFSADYYHFTENDYLLLNDPVNSVEQVFDVFIMQLPSGEKVGKPFISVVNEDGTVDLEGSVPYENDCMFMMHRGQKNYYIDLVQTDVYLAHLMYRKTEGKQITSRVVDQKTAKDRRTKLEEHITLVKKGMEDEEDEEVIEEIEEEEDGQAGEGEEVVEKAVEEAVEESEAVQQSESESEEVVQRGKKGKKKGKKGRGKGGPRKVPKQKRVSKSLTKLVKKTMTRGVGSNKKRKAGH